MTRKLAIFPATALVLVLSGPAVAADLIKFTDTQLTGSVSAIVYDSALATQWTQTAATTNVSIGAAFFGGNVNWWITDAIGSQATAANVLYSGSALVPQDPQGDYSNTDVPVLLTGGSFAPGSYYLVVGNGNANGEGLGWQFVDLGILTTNPAFSVGNSLLAIAGSDQYRSAFTRSIPPLVFQITGDIAAVPEPATWAMMLLGFGLVGGAMRAGRRTRVRYGLT